LPPLRRTAVCREGCGRNWRRHSGIEAAIDLAGIVRHVTVLEFLPQLKADKVLQERLYRLPNVTVLTNVQTKEFTGKEKLDGITYIERDTNQEKHIEVQGVFVQIGLVPNTNGWKEPLNAMPWVTLLSMKKMKPQCPGYLQQVTVPTAPINRLL